MLIEIRGRNLPFTPVMREHVERRLRFALSRWEDHVREVRVLLADVNGPHKQGDRDKECRVRLEFRPRGALQLVERNRDAVVAIHRAADRLGNTVARYLERARETATQSIRKVRSATS